MPKYKYQIQMENPKDGDSFLWKGEQWLTLSGFQDVSLQYAEGWCEGRRGGVLPCPGLRILRVDRETGHWKAVRLFPGLHRLSAGMVPAGSGHQWPYIMRAVEEGLKYAMNDAHADRGAPETDIAILLDMVRALRGRRSDPGNDS